jgi:predicted nucleotidyltransferase component of viral defense system
MLEPKPPAILDMSAWVLKARTNPALYRQRQTIEILLHAVAATPGFEGVFLKGGILMALAYGSPRNTGDIDFSAIGDPVGTERLVAEALDRALLTATRRSGYVDIICRIQRMVRRPRPSTFAASPFPALEISIGSALRTNAAEMTRLEARRATQVVRIDLSFREPIDSMQRLVLGGGQTIHAYGLHDLVAEKLRALLQQLTRPHPGERRQDVYDLAHLFRTFDLDERERAQILATLRHKSRERELEPVRGMIADDRIVSRLRASWPSLQAELEEKLPDFDDTFRVVQVFYEALPWEAHGNCRSMPLR